MSIWTFCDYVSDLGTNHVATWVTKELSTQEESNMDALLKALSKQRVWRERDYKVLRGQTRLSEIRWKGDQRRALRIIGFRSEVDMRFICFLGCSHKGNIYKPPDWLNTSEGRKKAFERKEGTICER